MRTPKLGTLGVAGLLALVLAFSGCGRGGRSPTSSPQVGTPQITDRGPGMRRQSLSSLQIPVPRTLALTHVDPKHFAAALGNDPVRIFEFVRDQIAYEVYTGYLRGPRGTLLAMAGNSVDRSALLASLLQQAGHKVRFARGTLPEREAKDLVMSMWAEHPRLPLARPTSGGDSSRGLSVAPATLRNAVNRDYTLIRDHLKKAGATVSGDLAPSLDALIKEAQPHFWVQLEKAGSWTDFDPSFADSTPGKSHARGDENLDTLPDALSHNLTIRIRVEEHTGATPSERNTLTFTARAADVAGVDVVLYFQPENWPGPVSSIARAIASAVSDTGRVKAVLTIGKQTVMGEPFRQKLKTTGIGGVGPLLGGEGTRKAVAIATAAALEVDFTAPGGERETAVREIFDLVGKARRAAGQTLTAEEVQSRTQADSAPDVTQSVYSLSFTTGRIDAGHFAGVAENPPPAEDAPLDIIELLRRVNVTFVASSDRLLNRLGGRERAIVLFYPDSPRLHITELSAAAPALRITLDLRRDHARAVAIGPRLEDVVAARIFRGVVDGTLERVLLEAVTARTREKGWTAPLVSTSWLFEQAELEGVPKVVLPGQIDRLDAGVPADALARLRDETSRGNIVVAPQRAIAVAGVPRFAWWRVRLTTGQTTGVIDEGLHAAVMEYKVVERQDQDKVYVYVIRGSGRPGRYPHTTIREFYYFQDPRFLAFIDDLLAQGFTLVP